MNLNRFMEDKAQALKEPQSNPSTSCNSFAELPDGHIPEGRKNTVMSRIAGKLVKRYGDTHEAWGIFLEKARNCAPPLNENELDGVWSSAVKFGKAVSAQPGYVPPEEYNDSTSCKPDDYSDVGQAYAFAKHYRNYVRYSPATDYIVYDGVCWQESKPRSQAAMQQFTDTQLAEAEAWLTRAEERLEQPGFWQQRTIADLLMKPEYLGHTVNFRTRRKSFKCKKTVWNDPSEWSIFENTHEPIIDQETFDIVQRIRDGRRRLTPIGEMPILSGMLFCADCGAKLYQVRARGWKHEQKYFTCASYRKGQGLCSSHQIHNVQVEEILLRQLKSITAYARSHETEFVELVTKQNEKEFNRLMRSSNKELVQVKERIKKLDGIMQRLYEDNIDGKISDGRFSRMSATYETEQKQLDARVSELEAAFAEAREQRLNVDSFLEMVRRYTDITELTAEIIRSFVEKIEVKKPEKVPGTRTKKQTLVIWWNFIGVVEIPQQEQKETA